MRKRRYIFILYSLFNLKKYQKKYNYLKTKDFMTTTTTTKRRRKSKQEKAQFI
jgi:hypothetical protein